MTIARAAALAAMVLMFSSCSKLRAIAGGGQASSPATQKPITGYEDGEEIHVMPGPPPTPSASNQGWHVQPLKCSADEKLLGMCGSSPFSPSHSSTYVPSYATPQVSPFHQRYGKWSRSR